MNRPQNMPASEDLRIAPASGYQMCIRCVMDTTDPEITFDASGICSHCLGFERNIRPYWMPNDDGAKKLAVLLEQVRSHGMGKAYDCIIGLSGGVDSSYLATRLKDWNLRPLVVHVDAGWNSELAVKNIEQITTRLGFELLTVVIDWQEMRDLQRSFLNSHVANQDIPQDHAFAAALVQQALKHDIKYVLSGSNFATEGVLPQSWGYDAMDSVHIRHIQRLFGSMPLKKFPILSFRDYYITMLEKLKFLEPLNLIPYEKESAIRMLEQDYNWRYYGGKHYESVWTRWYQAHYLPTKCGYDKRKAHLSSRIVAGSLSRDEALSELRHPLYTNNQLADDTAFIAKKLGYSVAELESLVRAPARHYSEFETNRDLLMRFRRRRKIIDKAKAIAGFAMSPRRVARRLLTLGKL